MINKIENSIKISLQPVSSPVRATVGDIARLSIEVKNIDVNNYTVIWKKEIKDDIGHFIPINFDGRHKICQSIGLLYLEICHCRIDDAGNYECIIETEKDSYSVKITLCITGNYFL